MCQEQTEQRAERSTCLVQRGAAVSDHSEMVTFGRRLLPGFSGGLRTNV